MAFLRVDQIRDLHLELTSRCNALCPQCSRVYRESLNPHLPLAEISAKDFSRFFSKEFCAQLHHVYLCGVHGDAAAAQDTIEVLKYLRECGVRQLSLFSNGGIRNSSWWESLGKLLHNPKDRVHFSIDGLADTNGMYRRFVDFEKVMENARAFLGAGGQANWDFLAFAHNQHQIEEARKLSQEMGFADFRLKHSSRFVGDSDAFLNATSDDSPVREAEALSALQRPRDQVASLKQNFEEYLASTKIGCKAKALGSIYVSFDGRVWPCCWTASNLYHPEPTPKKKNLTQLFSKYGEDFNSLYHHSLNEIMAHPWFLGHLEGSWVKGLSDCETPRLRACAQQCGEKYSAVAAQLDPRTRASKRL
jgi:MoaA/NifB/PqqE/SkfB family radical SAM enzyme